MRGWLASPTSDGDANTDAPAANGADAETDETPVASASDEDNAAAGCVAGTANAAGSGASVRSGSLRTDAAPELRLLLAADVRFSVMLPSDLSERACAWPAMLASARSATQ